MNIKQFTGRLLLSCCIMGSSLSLFSQSSWFVDGYHGGIWGHYPKGYTSFIIEQLNKHPEWRINLEIEPVTWDAAKVDDHAAYQQLRALLMDSTVNSRVEYVNPGYGQSYLYTVSGESIIRQFAYGMQKLRQHFPGIRFTTYSTEEPCFTSALPQVLQSFGYKYASLKNPNTCWGGYTRAHGGELVNWIGPDGSSVLTVPRYTSEELEPKSTWQTTAWVNSPAYVNAALQQGITHPVGMCLQDAGWRNGPWLGANNKLSPAPQYTTWRNYFEKVADRKLATDWKLSQEDIQVSLVWGAQVLQRIAQQVRQAEDRIVLAEKIAAMAAVNSSFTWPQEAFDRGWQNLLLAQHHDCWIVPYNGRRGDTWADKVKAWTAETIHISDSIMTAALAAESNTQKPQRVALYNTTGNARKELVRVSLEKTFSITAVQQGSQLLPVQWTVNDSGRSELLFPANTVAAGVQSYPFSNKKVTTRGASIQQRNGQYILETDLYRLTIDPAAGGAISSLISKQLNNKEWIRRGQPFNVLQGNFFEAGGQQSTATQAATITIIENGPLRIKAMISGTLAGNPWEQTITLVQGQPRIDAQVKINWQHHTGIGTNYKQDNTYKAEDYRKAFYDDRDKLLLSFPVNLDGQRIHKNAPFDVTTSQLDSTVFTTWDSIKNNVVLHWVDVTDAAGKYGLALFTDHTTAYVHGPRQPLSLVAQYAGKGLWGRNYILDGPTVIRYSLLPHAGDWAAANLEAERAKLAEPLQAVVTNTAPATNTFLRLDQKGWELSSLTMQGNDLLVRLYNAAGNNDPVTVYLHAPAANATLEQLDGAVISPLAIKKDRKGTVAIQVTAPRFGIRTVRFHLSK